jgi:hypothetical protein
MSQHSRRYFSYPVFPFHTLPWIDERHLSKNLRLHEWGTGGMGWIYVWATVLPTSNALLMEDGSRFRANAHLSDDETVAKMGHPSFVVV